MREDDMNNGLAAGAAALPSEQAAPPAMTLRQAAERLLELGHSIKMAMTEERENELCGARDRLLGMMRKSDALITAVEEWAGDCEGVPDDPSDANLLKALWTYDGDRTQPCEGCDGECGEPCAPCTVAAAHRSLDEFSAEWRKKHGIVQFLPPAGKTAAPQYEGEAKPISSSQADALEEAREVIKGLLEGTFGDGYVVPAGYPATQRARAFLTAHPDKEGK
ncbi:MAG: hypothetical protein JNL61_11420 [Rhizobiaceae bacterium]|nr:hypothetical protein [Rhizobiaceae bacterium]